MTPLTLGEIREYHTEMQISAVKSGDTFVTATGMKRDRLRIMGFDDCTVFYAPWQGSRNSWAYAGRRTFSYFRFERNALPGWNVGLEPFTDAELQLHRPHLPIRTAQSGTFNWHKRSFASLAAFKSYAQDAGLDRSLIEHRPSIDVPHLALIAFGARGGGKPVKVVDAEDGKTFSPLELLWKANEYLVPLNIDATIGVGLYRAGVDRKIPLYHVGEKFDALQMDMLHRIGLTHVMP